MPGRECHAPLSGVTAVKQGGNVSASVHQRLLDLARSDRRPFSELLQYYGMERFLYRLSCSAHRNRYILKGSLMLRVWHSPESRSTMDIDLLGRTENQETDIVRQFQDIIGVRVEPDGLSFDSDSIKTERISEEAEYNGFRIHFRGLLGSARINMQIDIGFGDVVHPKLEEANLPSMLGYPEARLLCYSRESVIAEKFHTIVRFGNLNSRMKDFYDIWLLCRQFDFDGATLFNAVRLTFEQRRTPLPVGDTLLPEEFITKKQLQWAAFRKRSLLNHAPESFRDIAAKVEGFLAPFVAEPTLEGLVEMVWRHPGPWIGPSG